MSDSRNIKFSAFDNNIVHSSSGNGKTFYTKYSQQNASTSNPKNYMSKQMISKHQKLN
jgi:hypothetical protein